MESSDNTENEKESPEQPAIDPDSTEQLTGAHWPNLQRLVHSLSELQRADSVEPVNADDEQLQELEDLGTYDDMFREYLREQRHWIGAAQQPLVFHIRKLCRKLDADPDAPASLSSAYLQAIRRLDLQRPGNRQPAGSDGNLPGQGSIFDELD